MQRFEVPRNSIDRWAYKTPSLRNIALTGPYMDDGSLSTLEAVVDFYNRGGIDNPLKNPRLKPFNRAADEQRACCVFEKPDRR